MDANLTTILTTVGIAAFGWAFKLGRDWVITKIQSSKNELFKKNMQILIDVVFDVVSALMQTTVNTFKLRNNGILDKNVATGIKLEAIRTVEQQLANHVIDYLEKETKTPIMNIIDTQIEKTVGYLRVEKNCQTI